jgi:ABC-type phosphate transport system permease subunit
METFLKADIFFFITTIAVIVCTLLIIVLFIYGIKVIRTVSKLSQKIELEGEQILKDVHQARNTLKSSAMASIASAGVSAGVSALTAVLTSSKSKKKSARVVRSTTTSDKKHESKK